MNVVNEKRQNLTILLLILLLASCNSQGASIGTTLTTTPAIQPIDTVAFSTLEATSVAPSLEAESHNLRTILFSECLKIRPDLPVGSQFSWNLFVKHGSVPYILALNTGIRTDELVPRSEIAWEYFISPDGKWLAYQKEDTNLFVEPANNILTNSQEGRIAWRNEQIFFRVQGWLNNNSVVLTSRRKVDPETFASTLILNPFDEDEHQFVLENLPDYLHYQPGMSGGYLFAHSNLMPDTSLRRLVYPALSNERFIAVLWDVENQKALANLRYKFDQFYNDPLWSLDGKDFLIMGLTEKSVEWFQVTRDGVIRQVTDFGDFQPDVFFTKPSRSWDGRYLAFQVVYNQEKNVKYLVLDLTSQTLQGFCVASIPLLNGNEQPPIWSPDSRYLVISNVDANSYGDLILVNVEARQAYQIGQDVHARGWIVNP